MDWLGLGKHSFTFGSTLFDIGSDIANSLNFLGVFNNDTYNEIVVRTLTNLTDPTTTYSTTHLRATIELIHCETSDQGQNFIWGVLSFGIVLLPGALAGLIATIREIHDRNWGNASSFLILGIPLLSVVLPFLVLLMPLFSIIQKCKKCEVDQRYQLEMNRYIAWESSIECTSQLTLQFFTLFNGYQGTPLQKVTIVASFFQIARCSMLNEIETKTYIMGGRPMKFTESIIETAQRLSLYVSTIIFRAGSLCIAMAYLRYYSLIPMAILLVVQSSISWARCKNMEDSTLGMHHTFKVMGGIRISTTRIITAFLLVIVNLGVITGYGLATKVGDEKDVVQFIKHSTIASFIYHSAMLIIIVITGQSFPNAMEHWHPSNPCDFPIKPDTQTFLWVFGAVLFMGFYSINVIMYRAPSMVQAKTKETQIKNDDGQLENISLNCHGSDLIERLEKAI